MQVEKIPLDETDCFSSFFIDYLSQKPELASFYGQFPTLKRFEQIISERSFDDRTREILADSLSRQYEGLVVTPAVETNIQQLKNTNAFTITTGHQLNIFTGPLYFIYKIVTVINTCKTLKKSHPDSDFIPVYWMASEDHDYDEINHFFFDEKKYKWETEQSGAVGRFTPNGLSQIAKELPSSAQFFREAYSEKNLSDAVRKYVNHLFGEEGLVVLDADDHELKRAFTSVIEDDLFEHTPNKLVPKTSLEIEKLGYKTQVHCREINFFYLEGSIRERIEKEQDVFKVLNTDLAFSAVEMKQLIADHPERFSPNVILRPLYQETILPNLAYVGGPSEVTYWLQLKPVFDHFDTEFPALMPRNFATVISKNTSKKWEKTNLSSQDLFRETDALFAEWVTAHSHNDLSLDEEINQIKEAYAALERKVKVVDPTLQQHIEALHATTQKKVLKAEKKLVRAEKRKHAEKKSQIAEVKDLLFPGGTLQERKDNFLNFFQEDPQFIEKLLEIFDPFDYRMYLLFLA